MGRWKAHLWVVGALSVLVALISLKDVFGPGRFNGLIAFFAIGVFAFYAGVSSLIVGVLGRTPRGVFMIHGALFSAVVLFFALQLGASRGRRPPESIPGRKAEIVRWWLHEINPHNGYVYVELATDFVGKVNFREFATTAAGQTVLEASQGQEYRPARPGSNVVLRLTYSRRSTAVPDAYLLRFQLESELTGRGETLEYATNFDASKDSPGRTSRPVPPPIPDPELVKRAPEPDPGPSPFGVRTLTPGIAMGMPKLVNATSPAEEEVLLIDFVTRNREQLLDCAVESKSTVRSGDLTLHVELNRTGKAEKVSFPVNELESPAAIECMKRTVTGWAFPIGEVQVDYPFSFSGFKARVGEDEIDPSMVGRPL